MAGQITLTEQEARALSSLLDRASDRLATYEEQTHQDRRLAEEIREAAGDLVNRISQGVDGLAHPRAPNLGRPGRTAVGKDTPPHRHLPGRVARGPDSGVAGRGDRGPAGPGRVPGRPAGRFVPAEAVGQAYLDQPIRIPHGQVTTQPSLIAAMVAALGLTGGERVLEVGTGLGFQTAILARLARQVVSIERLADLAAQARANLAAAGVGRVTVVVGDGTLGVPEHAPYQAIVVSAASPWVPAPLVEQLAHGGRLVHPVGPGGHEQVTAFHKEADRLVADTRLIPARFVPLVGAHGTPSPGRSGRR